MAPSKFKEISISSSRQYHKKSNSWIRNEKYLYDINTFLEILRILESLCLFPCHIMSELESFLETLFSSNLSRKALVIQIVIKSRFI